jgi:hypothetical protein
MSRAGFNQSIKSGVLTYLAGCVLLVTPKQKPPVDELTALVGNKIGQL